MKKARHWRPDPAAPLETSTPAKQKGRFPKEGLLSELESLASDIRERVEEEVGADALLQHAMSACIEFARSRYALDPGARWKEGEPLKLLLAGYSGTRNTGADVRVEEMIRQFRAIFGDEHLEMSILTIDPELTRGYFPTVKQLLLPNIFPQFLTKTVHAHHGVIACEGSMFKSKFANALSTMMVGAIGLALAEEKIAVGYGGEAGNMDPHLRDLVQRHCQGALIIARNKASQGVLGKLGIESTPGTDTAWTYEPGDNAKARTALIDRGWDGETPILALAPINPFWWPVKPNPKRALFGALSGSQPKEHFRSLYYHAGGKEIDQAQDRYLQAIADATNRWQQEEKIFPVLFGSEQLDRLACEALAKKLDCNPPVIVSDEFPAQEMVALMRQSTYMASSRYHAIVMTMAGGVCSAGITMDERIRNLMVDRKTPELALECDSENLAEELYETFLRLRNDRERILDGIDECIVQNLERMGMMGQILVERVREKHPKFPFASHIGMHGDPWDHLPPLSQNVQGIVERVRKREGKSSSPKRRSLQQ